MGGESRGQAGVVAATGLGTLLAAIVGTIGRIGAAPTSSDPADQGTFFLGAALSVTLLGAVAAAGRRLWQRASPSTCRLVPQLAMVAGFVSAAAGLAGIGQAGVPVATPLPGLGGAAFGAGSFAMALAWMVALARASYLGALACGAWAMTLGVALFAVLVGVRALAGGVFLGPALLAISALCGVCSLSRAPAHKGEGAQRGASPSDKDGKPVVLAPASALGILLRTAWAPLCGLAIYAFMLGTFWAVLAPGQQEAATAPGNVDWAGPLAATFAFALVTRRLDRTEDARQLLWLVIPLAAVLFLAPLHMDSSQPPLSTLMANLQNIAATALLACTGPLLLSVARTIDAPVSAVFGGCFAVVAGAGALGFVCNADGAVSSGQTMVFLFEAYLCALVVFLVRADPGGGEARETSAHAIENYIRPRCEHLAAERGLTRRESEILAYLARGHSYTFIAESTYVSETTIRTHASNIYRKLGIRSQEELLRLIDA